MDRPWEPPCNDGVVMTALLYPMRGMEGMAVRCRLTAIRYPLACRTVFPKARGRGACGARVQAAIGLTPLAAPVPPTERAGSKGSIVCRSRGGGPLWWVLGNGGNVSLWQ